MLSDSVIVPLFEAKFASIVSRFLLFDLMAMHLFGILVLEDNGSLSCVQSAFDAT